jgi:DNA-binding NarL/FixJ family response regulator
VVDAVNRAARGERTIQVPAPLLPTIPPAGTEGTDSGISRREVEVLQLIAKGASTTEVAGELFISSKTVKNHLASVYQKLGSRDRTQAILRAVRLGIITLD